jgi:hypothetical protein
MKHLMDLQQGEEKKYHEIDNGNCEKEPKSPVI